MNLSCRAIDNTGHARSDAAFDRQAKIETLSPVIVRPALLPSPAHLIFVETTTGGEDCAIFLPD
jgi:hypothetical protein